MGKHKHHRTGKTHGYAGTEGRFLLPHHENELERLRKQHALFLSNVPDGLIKTPLPPDGSNIRLLDVGCADGTWLLTVAHAFPQLHWSLHGVDNHRAFFRHADKTGEKLDLHVHDVHHSVPEKWGWNDSFDIVQQRLMIWALKTGDWPMEVRNLAALVKPGGWMQLVEVEWVPREGSAAVEDPLLAKLKVLQEWTCHAHDMDIRVADRLEQLLGDEGFKNVQVFEYTHGIGAAAREDSWKGPSADMFIDTFRVFEHKMSAAGIPGVAETPDELHHFLDDVTERLKQVGDAPKMRIVIGQKP